MKKILFILLILGNIIMAATIQKIELGNKEIPVIFEEDSRLPLVSFQFVFTNAGSITDVQKSGLAKMSAKMMSEGTKELGSNGFAEALEAKAIHISSHVGRETFVIEVSCLKGEFKTALSYMADLLKSPNLTPEALKKVKATTLGSISAQENNFDTVASKELKKIMFKGTPLANPSSGTKESVESIELKDIEAFVKKNLVSSKLIVLLGGDIDFASVKKDITDVIELLPKGRVSKIKNYKVVKTPSQSVLKRETQQAYLYFGSPYNMESAASDYYKAKVATFILGSSGFGSRLMEEIRVKRGLAYSAYISVHVGKSSSYMSGYLQTKLESLEEAQKTVKEVIADFVKNGVTKDELKQTKKFLLGSEPLRVETMSQRLNRTFMEYYKGQELGHSQRELELIKNLKLKDLNKFIKEHTEILEMSYAIVTK